nr:NAD-dependent epimerase/dehydratase family protein [Nocardioides aurantiacus]
MLGATGFVGSAVVEALTRRGAGVRHVRAPRLTTSARTAEAVLRAVHHGAAASVVDALSDRLRGVDAVVNAAGLATASSVATDALYGANALLPAFVTAAVSGLEGAPRFVHVSSAAVQGRAVRLDESPVTRPFSAYSHSKALGEAVVGPAGTVFRPTSVHGAGRPTTALLRRLVSSPIASVAGEGASPTPQVQVVNVGDAIAFVTLTGDPPPRFVLQPAEDLTVAGLVRLLGGREPRHVPEGLARAVVRVGFGLGGRSPRLAGPARRLEMLWFGQGQERGWLAGRWRPPAGPEGWRELW